MHYILITDTKQPREDDSWAAAICIGEDPNLALEVAKYRKDYPASFIWHAKTEIPYPKILKKLPAWSSGPVRQLLDWEPTEIDDIPDSVFDNATIISYPSAEVLAQQKREEKEFEERWRQEIANEAGMAFGCDAYNDIMGDY
jgi:hypothetical protein